MLSPQLQCVNIQRYREGRTKQSVSHQNPDYLRTCPSAEDAQGTALRTVPGGIPKCLSLLSVEDGAKAIRVIASLAHLRLERLHSAS